MASIHEELSVHADPEEVWAAIRDVGEVHRRLAPGFVTATRLADGVRFVTFANGMIASERIVALDDGARRLAYSASGGRLTFHHASMQVFPAPGGGARLVWITDLLPDDAAGAIRALVEQGAAVMKETLERR